jgi:hypothetical protein
MCFGIPDRDGSGIKGLHVKSLTGLPHKKYEQEEEKSSLYALSKFVKLLCS